MAEHRLRDAPDEHALEQPLAPGAEDHEIRVALGRLPDEQIGRRSDGGGAAHRPDPRPQGVHGRGQGGLELGSRLVLAQMLFDPPNFLVLDEPTNHLDLATKEMLVQTLAKFEGTMLFVSHDRTFLRGLATQVLDLSGGGDGTASKPLVFERPYADWVARTGHEAPGVRR